MAGKVTIMSKIKQLLLMHQQGASNRSIASRLGLDKGTVNSYVNKVRSNAFDITQLLSLDSPLLESYFISGSPAYCSKRYSVLRELLPYFADELKVKHVTRRLLWEEYKSSNPDGYRYTQFCHHLQQYLMSKKGSVILDHLPCGELYVDFAGESLHYIDPSTNTKRNVKVFIGCMPYSSYTFVMGVESERAEDFLHAIECCLTHLGGVPPVLVTDNLKASVIKSDRYEPTLNVLMLDFANHYGMTVSPTRPYKPKDKAQVEGAVKIIYNRVYAKIRNQCFFSLSDLNTALLEKTMEHNQTRMQQKGYSREEKFLSDERPLLKPLPSESFMIKHYARLRVDSSSHIFLSRDKHHYSVPYQYNGKKATVIYTRTMVKIYCDNALVATHQRSVGTGSTTVLEHLSPNYRHYVVKSKEDYLSTAREKSAVFERYLTHLFEHPLPPHSWWRTCDGLLSLSRKTPISIFEMACNIALENEVFSYKFVKNTIAGIMTNATRSEDIYKPLPSVVENIRDCNYYK